MITLPTFNADAAAYDDDDDECPIDDSDVEFGDWFADAFGSDDEIDCPF